MTNNVLTLPSKNETVLPAKPLEQIHRRRRRSIIREFALNASSHALPNIVRSESIYNYVFWTIAFIAFTGVMIYCIIKAIIDYLGYPTSIDVSYSADWKKPFVALSFCNISPLRFDRFIEPFLNFTNTFNLTNTKDTTTISEYQADLIRPFFIYEMNQNHSIESYLFSLSSMLVSCYFNEKICKADDFIPFLSESHGLCYTFNAKMKNSTSASLRRGNLYGDSSILTLSFYIHSHQYVPFIGSAAGMILLIHDNTELPRIEVSGLELEPGKRHKMVYNTKITNFLGSPYTRCTNKLNAPMKAMINSYNGADYGYSQSICYQVCQQVYLYEKCKCVNPILWNTRWVTQPDTDELIFAPLCNISNNCYSNASNTLFSSASALEKYCSDCSQECIINSFTVQKSASRLTINEHLNKIKAFVENSSVPLPPNWSEKWREYIHDNYLSVTIMRETNIIETNTQSASIGPFDLLSNIGGQTGLWIGISFLSIMETAIKEVKVDVVDRVKPVLLIYDSA